MAVTPEWPEGDGRALLESDPGPEGLSRMATSLGGGNLKVLGRLVGGLDCSTHLLAQAGRRLVLKRYKPGAVPARVEFENLAVARFGALPTPEPVALDEAAEWFGTQALVMTALEGKAELFPSDTLQWVGQLATALAAVHETPARDLSVRPEPLWQRWEPWVQPPDDRMRAITAAVRMLKESAASEKTVFSHGDYHPGNVLFHNGELSGVVDWMRARPEPRQHDVAYCRKDLAVHPGGDLADQFLRAYEAEVGVRLNDMALWDVLCGSRGMQYARRWIPSFAEMNVDLSGEAILERSTAFVEEALVRAGLGRI